MSTSAKAIASKGKEKIVVMRCSKWITQNFNIVVVIIFRYNMDNTMEGFYIAREFMDKLVVHITKNFMNLPNIKVTRSSHLYQLF